MIPLNVKRMPMVRHDFHFKKVYLVFIAYLFNDFLKPCFYIANKNFSPVFRTPDHMILAAIYDIVITFVFHTCIIPQIAI